MSKLWTIASKEVLVSTLLVISNKMQTTRSTIAKTISYLKALGKLTILITSVSNFFFRNNNAFVLKLELLSLELSAMSSSRISVSIKSYLNLRFKSRWEVAKRSY